MNEDKKPSTSVLFKKSLLILCIFAGIELLMLVYLIVLDQQDTIGKENFPSHTTITSKDIKTNASPAAQQLSLTTLDVLPQDYDTLIKYTGRFSPHELTTYLRYSEVIKSSTSDSLTDAYQYLEENNLGLLIPQSYIDQYILAQSTKIINLIQKGDSTSTIHPTSVYEELLTCVSQDIESFLKNLTCQDKINKISSDEYSPTLSFLNESLKVSTLHPNNDYDTFVNNNLYIYQIVKDSPSTSNITANLTNDIYLDLDNTHLQKANLILNYLKIVSSDLKNSQVNREISSFEHNLILLNSYKYSDKVPQDILAIIFDPHINLSQEEIQKLAMNVQINLLIKNLNTGETIKTFIAPMYVFSMTDNTKIASLTFKINDNNFNEDYDITPSAQSKGSVRVPIFMYHQIAPVPQSQSTFQSGLYINPSDFEKEMAYLVKKNYKTVSSQEYYDLLMTGRNPSQKTVMLTFDDGVSNHYTTVYPILKRYDLTGVFYVISQRSALTLAQRKEMSDNGMIIDSHSARHPDLTKVSDPTQLASEIISSRYAIQATTEKPVYSFAYPGCGWTNQVLSYVANAGYLLGMSCGSTIDNYPAHRLVLSRVHAFGDMEHFKNQLSGIR